LKKLPYSGLLHSRIKAVRELPEPSLQESEVGLCGLELASFMLFLKVLERVAEDFAMLGKIVDHSRMTTLAQAG
jgi:hypothetical protein